MQLKLYILLPFFCFVKLTAQKSIFSGPTIGHITCNKAKASIILHKVKTCVIELKTDNLELVKCIILKTDTIAGYKTYSPINLEWINLNANTHYKIFIKTDDKSFVEAQQFTTLQNTSVVSDFTFLTGSCAMMLPKIFNSFTAMGSDRIFKIMRLEKSDFMIWSGDFLYYLKKDFSSPSNMWKRQLKARKRNNLNFFLRTTSQYAIWDDHDYGSFNSDKNFPFKDTSLYMHKKLWANPSYGTPDLKGVFTKFSMYDCDFFMLDNRFYNTSPTVTPKEMISKAQCEWLFKELEVSKAAFKFIVVGSQFINALNADVANFNNLANEGFSLYPEERKMILNFIEAKKVNGVIFITGDRHFAELRKLERKNNYPLYDFTTSPLTSFIETPTKQEDTTTRIPGTLYKKHNFGKIAISGESGNRKCTIMLYNRKAKMIWSHSILESELK